MPIITTFETRASCSSRSSRASRRSCSLISSGARLRPRPMRPVAQNVQASAQPDCDERQTVRRGPWLMATASSG